MRKIFWLVLLILLIVSILYFRQGGQYQSLLRQVVDRSDEKGALFIVEKGWDVSKIAQKLIKQNLIVSAETFENYVKTENWENKLQAGRFWLKRSFTIPEIAAVIAGKKSVTINLTIPEGFTIKQIDALLTKKDLITAGDFERSAREYPLASLEELLSKGFNPVGVESNFTSPLTKGGLRGVLEGFLFPDTYSVDPANFSAENLIDRMLREFDRKFTAKMREDLRASGRTLLETVIMASLIEEETRTNTERPIVAGILWKRLDSRWFLGVDATLRYFKNDWEKPLTQADLLDDNPYNTRKRLGLPPTAIASPGLASLKAAVYPQATGYWYYLHDKNGQIHYAATEAEHIRNKNLYLR